MSDNNLTATWVVCGLIVLFLIIVQGRSCQVRTEELRQQSALACIKAGGTLLQNGVCVSHVHPPFPAPPPPPPPPPEAEKK